MQFLPTPRLISFGDDSLGWGYFFVESKSKIMPNQLGGKISPKFISRPG